MNDDRIKRLRWALEDFVDFHDDPNMSMKELVERAKKVLEETK